MGLLERRLHDEMDKSVAGRKDSTAMGKAIGLERRVIAYLLGRCHYVERFDTAVLFLLVIER